MKLINFSEGNSLINQFVAEPTKYYSVEGVNVFFELKHKGETVDPLNHME